MNVKEMLETIGVNLEALTGMCDLISEAMLEGHSESYESCGNSLWLIRNILREQSELTQKALGMICRQQKGDAA